MVELDFTTIEQNVARRLAHGNTGTYSRTRYTSEEYETSESHKGYRPKKYEETRLDVLDASVRAALGAIWQWYLYLANLSPPSFPRMRIVANVATRAAAGAWWGNGEHIHTSACEAGQADCPIYEAGMECAKETVGEWYEPEHPDFP